MTDLRFAFRQFLQKPGFTATAVLVLALGIGANVAVFSLVTAFNFAPLPVRDPDQLVAITVPEAGNVFSEPRYATLSSQTNVLSEFTAYAQSSLIVRRGETPTRRTIEYVSPNYFDFLGVNAPLGRLLSESDRKLPHLVISDRFWEREFDRDRGVIGQGVDIQGKRFTIVGVAPRRFVGTVMSQPADGWIPFELESDLGQSGENPYYSQQRWLNVLARLREGASLAAATESLRAIESDVLEPWMLESQRHIELVPCGRGLMPVEQRLESARTNLFMTLVMALVLFTACANLASLLLSRGVNRRREFAVRLALGASRVRLIRQLLLESLLLALAGGFLGMLLSWWGVRAALVLIPYAAKLAIDVPMDVSVLPFTLGLSTLAALGFGLIPALHATSTELHVALKDETRGLTSRRHWHDARNLLVVSQVSICVVLLIATGLVWRSLDNRRSLETGFDSRDIVVASIWDREQSMSAEGFVDRLNELRNELTQLPGVQAASLVTHAPMGLQVEVMSVFRGPSQETGEYQVTANSLSLGFFNTLRVPLLAGRDFTEQDRAGNTPVAILSAKLAEALFPGESALGQRVRAHDFHEVIGVVGDVRYMRFDASYLSGTIYFSAAQVPFGNSPNLLVRSDQSNHALTAAVVAKVRDADPGRQHPVVQSYAKYMDEILARERSATWLLGVAATIGLGLVSLGLYGVISYHVAQRTREIGLRMALGALRRQVLLLMLRRGLVLTAVGTLVGGVAALGTSRLLRSLLHGVSTTDPVTFAGVCLVMIVISTLACWLPGRRAMKIEPMEALRHD